MQDPFILLVENYVANVRKQCLDMFAQIQTLDNVTVLWSKYYGGILAVTIEPHS